MLDEATRSALDFVDVAFFGLSVGSTYICNIELPIDCAAPAGRDVFSVLLRGGAARNDLKTRD